MPLGRRGRPGGSTGRGTRSHAIDLILAGEPAGEFTAWHEHPDDELLAGLAQVQGVVAQADAALHDYVDVLRDRGISWTRIGEALGVSKQAAWERFSGED